MGGFHSLLSKFRKAQHGMASVEFAIVLPVLLIILVGMIDFGRMLTDYEVANKSVRDAARFLARARMDCPAAGTGPAADYLVNATFATLAQNLALTGKAATPTTGSYLLAYWTDPATVTMNVTCVANGGTYAGVFTDLAFIPRITVTANVPFSFMFGTIVLGSASTTLVAAHTTVGIGE
jgi:Flp pilus assembly protein TadG